MYFLVLKIMILVFVFTILALLVIEEAKTFLNLDFYYDSVLVGWRGQMGGCMYVAKFGRIFSFAASKIYSVLT